MRAEHNSVCSVKEFVGERLPVGNGGIENLIADVAYQFSDQSFLHLRELQVGIIGCCGRELSFPALVCLAVFKTNVHRETELHLRRVTIGRNRFVELIVAGDFARKVQVAVAFHHP